MGGLGGRSQEKGTAQEGKWVLCFVVTFVSSRFIRDAPFGEWRQFIIPNGHTEDFFMMDIWIGRVVGWSSVDSSGEKWENMSGKCNSIGICVALIELFRIISTILYGILNTFPDIDQFKSECTQPPLQKTITVFKREEHLGMSYNKAIPKFSEIYYR